MPVTDTAPARVRHPGWQIPQRDKRDVKCVRAARRSPPQEAPRNSTKSDGYGRAQAKADSTATARYPASSLKRAPSKSPPPFRPPEIEFGVDAGSGSGT